MKSKLPIFLMCLLGIVLLGQNQIDNKTTDKTTSDKPSFSIETHDPDLSRTTKPENPSTSVMPEPEDQAWQMIFDALEKEEPSDLSSSKPPEHLKSPSIDDSERINVREEPSGKSDKGNRKGPGNGKGRGSGEEGGNRGPDHRPPGWDKGEKEGWDGGNVPPGLRKDHPGRRRGGK